MQVPPPPQADGKKILLFPSVVRSVLPDPTSTSCDPLIISFTGPEGSNLALTPNSIPTNRNTITIKTTTLERTTVISIMLKS